MDHGKREAGGDGSIDGVASRVQHLDPSARGEFVDAGDNGVRSMRRPQRRSPDGRGEYHAEAAEDQKSRSYAHGLGVRTFEAS